MHGPRYTSTSKEGSEVLQSCEQFVLSVFLISAIWRILVILHCGFNLHLPDDDDDDDSAFHVVIFFFDHL